MAAGGGGPSERLGGGRWPVAGVWRVQQAAAAPKTPQRFRPISATVRQDPAERD